jgi:iron complex transport system permease protein
MAGISPRRRFLLSLAAYLLLALAVLTVAPLFGSEQLHWSALRKQLAAGEMGVELEILLMQRLPRVILGFLVGGALALAGAVFQVLLRNPLAEPYTLGITGGAALGAAAAINIPALNLRLGPFSTVQLCALAGAGLTIALVYRLARRPEGISMGTLLLAGVTIGILSSALILLVRYLISPHLLLAVDRWLMGGLDVVGYRELAALFPLLLPGLGLMLMQMNTLNLLAFGEELAAGHGVDVAAAQRQAFLGAALVTAAVVSLAGPIGFVGLIIPHAVRRLSGFDQRIVLPAAFLTGGAFLVLCDILSRTLVAPMELPVGIITALIGGPIFIRLLLRR